MARPCWPVRRRAPAIWVRNSNGTNGRVGVRNSSLSKLLRWDWNLERSIATGTNNSEPLGHLEPGGWRLPGGQAGDRGGLGGPRKPIILDAALGPHDTLDRVRKHEKMGLTIRRVVLDDLLGRNSSPGIIEPSIPDVVWISVAAKLHHELRLHNIARTTAEQRFGVSLPIRMCVVIGALETFEPFFVRPFPVRETCRTQHKCAYCRQEP